MEQLGTLETICRYPVKSMAGEAVDRAFVGYGGLMGDRVYAFVRADGVHTVVDAIAAATGIAFNVIKRRGMHHGAGRPRNARSVGRFRDHLQGRRGIGAETADGLGARLAGIVAGDDPGARDGILAEFHGKGKHRERAVVNRDLAR